MCKSASHMSLAYKNSSSSACCRELNSFIYPATLIEKEKEKNADGVNTTGKDWERMLFCVLQHPMDAEAHNIPPGE